MPARYGMKARDARHAAGLSGGNGAPRRAVVESSELLEAAIANYGCSKPDPEGRVFAVTSLHGLPGDDVAEFAARHVQAARANPYELNPSRRVPCVTSSAR